MEDNKVCTEYTPTDFTLTLLHYPFCSLLDDVCADMFSREGGRARERCCLLWCVILRFRPLHTCRLMTCSLIGPFWVSGNKTATTNEFEDKPQGQTTNRLPVFDTRYDMSPPMHSAYLPASTADNMVLGAQPLRDRFSIVLFICGYSFFSPFTSSPNHPAALHNGYKQREKTLTPTYKERSCCIQLV